MNPLAKLVLLLCGAGWAWALSSDGRPTDPPPAVASVRLPDRGHAKAAPPTAAPAAYPIDETELLGKALGSETTHWVLKGRTQRPIECGVLQAGRAYTLEVRAKQEGGGVGTIAVRFREGEHHGTFRTYEARVASDTPHDYRIAFTAPLYTCEAELALTSARDATLTVEGLSLKMRAPRSWSAPVSSWEHSYVPEGYSLVFNDEFSGNTLDRSKWFTRFIYGSEGLDHLNKERQRYADHQNQDVHDGVLHLVARKAAGESASGRDFESGMIRSDWTVHYGFFEARVRMPSARGVWPAFWLNSDVSESGRLGWPPEIDIFEFVNNGKDDKVNMLHMAASTLPGAKPKFSFLDKAYVVHWQDYVAPFDFDKGWHTIGAEWTPDELTSYVDGVKVASRSDFRWVYKDGTQAGPAHIILNLAVGGSWAGRYGVDEGDFPQALEVDWVRAYQRVDERGHELATKLAMKGCTCRESK
ncbi:MAG TPA: glycoside hydrolase family 16 protein [Polyangia bacterium]|nr:glycoside hydrolase family 16 protein [Polyangia bacterium]